MISEQDVLDAGRRRSNITNSQVYRNTGAMNSVIIVLLAGLERSTQRRTGNDREIELRPSAK